MAITEDFVARLQAPPLPLCPGLLGVARARNALRTLGAHDEIGDAAGRDEERRPEQIGMAGAARRERVGQQEGRHGDAGQDAEVGQGTRGEVREGMRGAGR